MIKIDNINKSYNKVKVLNGVTLDIPDGRITTIVGASGAGKTTLLQIMASLEKADSGTVKYDDIQITRLKDKALSRFRNRHIGLVFQQHRLLPEFTIVENVMMPALIAGESHSKARQSAEKWLTRLGLEDRLSHRPGELSGGECQRASVARAMINNPKVILADEPTGSLDTENRQHLHNIFFDLRNEFGTTFVIVTHDETLAADSDLIVRLRDGVIDEIIDKDKIGIEQDSFTSTQEIDTDSIGKIE